MRRGKSCFRRKPAALTWNILRDLRPHQPRRFKWWKLAKIDRASRNPYWILQVPDEIIHEHSPIFTPAGRAMMAALFRISNPEDAEGPRQMRLSP